MVGKIILILGGGFGGLVVVQQLRRRLAPEHHVVVVEKQDTFSLCAFNMRCMIGEIRDKREVERPLSELADKGVEWVHGEVLEIDPTARSVRTSSGTLEGDYLIIALGAEKDASSIPGFAESYPQTSLNMLTPVIQQIIGSRPRFLRAMLGRREGQI